MTLELLQIKRKGTRWVICSGLAEFPEEYQTKEAAQREAERMEQREKRYGLGGYEFTANPSR